MYIVATFEHSLHLELLLSELENRGITHKSILALPLRTKGEEKKIFDSIHYADGISLFDGAFSLGSASMIIGVIYGFRFEWGPIIWGLLGLIGGGFIGFIMDYYIGKLRKRRKGILNSKNITSEVVMMIHTCHENLDMVERTLWDYDALGIAILER